MDIKKLGFGFMRLPVKEQIDQSSIDMDTLNQMVDTFLDRGFTYFDTAYMYHTGKSENAIRESLVKRHKRDSFTLATKLPMMSLNSKEDMERIFSEQLEKCGVEYFDYYLLHNLNVSHYELANKLGSFDFIMEKKKEGKIKRIGFSYHDKADLLDEILTAHPEVEFVQLQINYLDWDSESIQSRKCYEVARKHKVPVIVMEPVKGGKLAKVPEEAEKLLKSFHPEMSVPSWAIRYAASLEGVMMVLSGMSDLEQLMDNTGYMQEVKPFTKEEYDIVDKTAQLITEAMNLIPCTACHYCEEGCPKGIVISTCFALYNKEIETGYALKQYYYGATQDSGKASDCIECNQCEKNCPQHLEIIKYLKDVVQMFEV